MQARRVKPSTATERAASATGEAAVKDLASSGGNQGVRRVAEAVRLCAILGRLYRLPGAAEGTFSLHWGNGVLHDQQQHRERMLSEVEAGILAPERYLAQVYGLPCQTAPDREKIRREYMPVG